VLIAAYRLARAALHLVAGLACAFAFPRLDTSRRERIVAWWSRGLLDALGVKLRVDGEPPQAPGLLVANHISWLDVAALAALRPALFVCKSEIATWPAIGWLLSRAGTLFLRRGSLRDLWRVHLQLRETLRGRRDAAAFPEGTTTEGSGVLPFRPALFQAAIDAGVPVQPLALAYNGPEAAYVGDTSFARSLAAIATARKLELRVAVLEPLDTGGANRKVLALRARLAIASCL
jgi:1-acyl-sn-glycerol-3-phosphate acyltransferase